MATRHTTVFAHAFEKARQAQEARQARPPAQPAGNCLFWPLNYPFEQAVDTLRRAGVQAIADLRSPAAIRADASPAAWKPSRLKTFLKDAHGIGYVRLGALGNRPEHAPFYRRGRLQKNLLKASEPWQNGFKRLLHGIATYRVCILTDSPIPASNVACEALRLASVSVLHLSEYHRLPAAA